MTANDRRIRQRVQEELVTRGWEELSSPGVLRYGEFYIYLYQEEQDKVRDEVTSFVYDEAELCSGRVLRRPVNYHMNYFLPDYNWWVEYCGVLVAMGRFKKTALSTEKTTKQFLECIEGIDRLAKGGPEKAMLGRPSYSQHTISVMQRTLVPYNGEMRSDIYLQQKDNLYYFVKRISNTEDAPGSIYALVPVVCTTHGDFVDVTLDQTRNGTRADYQSLVEILASGELPPYYLLESPCNKKEMQWDMPGGEIGGQPDNPIVKDFDSFKLNGAQKGNLSCALNEVYNVTPLLDNRIDALTGSWLLQFMREGFDISDIRDNFSSDVLKFLFHLAEEGIALKKYANPGYTASRLQTMYSDFLSSFSVQEKELKKLGYDEQQIWFIRSVASRGKGFSHLKTGEPLNVLWMRDEIEQGHHIKLMTWMIPYASTDCVTNVRIPWKVLPAALQEYVVQMFKAVPDFRMGGYQWENIVDYAVSHATGIYYCYKYGVMLNFDYKYMAMDHNSVMLKDSGFINKANAIYVNGKMFVNDLNFSLLGIKI